MFDQQNLDQYPKLSILKSNSINSQYKCPYSQPVYRICTSSSCVKPALCCQDQDCQCNTSHQLCPLIKCKTFLDKVKAKIINYDEILKSFNQLFDNIIDQISTIRQQSEKCIKRYGLKKQQADLLDYFQDNRVSSLTGKVVSEAKKYVDTQVQVDFTILTKQIQRFWNETCNLVYFPLYLMKDLVEMPLLLKRLNAKDFQKLSNEMVSKVEQSRINQIKSNNQDKKAKQTLAKKQQKIQSYQIPSTRRINSQKNPVQLEQKKIQKTTYNIQRNQLQKRKLKQAEAPKLKNNYERRCLFNYYQDEKMYQKPARRSQLLYNPFLIQPKAKIKDFDIFQHQQQQQQNKNDQRDEILQPNRQPYDQNQNQQQNEQQEQDDQNQFDILGLYEREMQISNEINQNANNAKENDVQKKVQVKVQKQQGLLEAQKPQKLQKIQKKQQEVQKQEQKKPSQEVKPQKLSPQESVLEATRYLYEILGTEPIKCVKFVNKKGFENGKLLDKQKILDLALADPQFLS